MFGFLKDKIKKVIGRFSKEVDAPDKDSSEGAAETTATEKPETAATEQLETAATEQLETAATEKPETAATEKPETAATEKPETAATEKPESAATQQLETAATEKPETAATEKPESAIKEDLPLQAGIDAKPDTRYPARHEWLRQKPDLKKGPAQREKGRRLPREDKPRQATTEAPPDISEEDTLHKGDTQPGGSDDRVIAPQAASADKPEQEAAQKAAAEKKQGIFSRLAGSLVTKSLSEQKFNELFWELEVAMLENNVAMDVVDKIREDLKRELVQSKIRFGKAEETISSALAGSIRGLFSAEGIDLIESIQTKKPFVILFLGVNGSGKTTTIAKLTYMLQRNNISCVIAAADTFRAAAIQQIEEHGRKLGIKVIKHDYGADPAAVAFDAIQYAKAKGADAVLIDTAGRQHSNTNLMDELRKVVRVSKPDLKVFVGESITGNDCIEQAQRFNDAVGIDAIILTKADVDEKGGAALSVSYVTRKPIIFLGTGQTYDSLKPFQPEMMAAQLGLEPVRSSTV